MMSRMDARDSSARILVALSLLIALTPVAEARLYKWTDAQGNVQYSDRPPPSERGAAPDSVEAIVERQRAELRAREEAERRERIRAAAARATPAPPVSPAPTVATGPVVESKYTCEDARRFLAHFQSGSERFYSPAEGGGFRPTSEAEREAIVAQWREAVALLCREGAQIVRE